MADTKKITEITEDATFDEKMDAAEAVAAEDPTSSVVIEFKKPFEFEGKTYEALHFDFESLTGKDSQAIFNELKMLGTNVFPNLAWSDAAYVIRFAAKCCKEGLGTDAFSAMPAAIYNKIISRTSSFLMREAL